MEKTLIIIFLLGYVAIAIESSIKINKAATALLTAIACWTIYALNPAGMQIVTKKLTEQFSDIAGILFFLIGAMTIVELIDLNNGFDFISEKIKTRNKTSLLWIIASLGFFFSAVLDNLTTSIVMIAITRKLVPEKKDILWFAAIIIIAANAGGAWSPIGDVTTTMLWIGGQISTFQIIHKIFLPSLVSLLVPLFIFSLKLKGKYPPIENKNLKSSNSKYFYLGVGLLLLVPVFKIITHLPPFMGMFFSIGLFWLIMEIKNAFHKNPEKHRPTVAHALQNIDGPSIMFFAGILLAVAVLDATGILSHTARFLSAQFSNIHVVAVITGLTSAIFDNVPLVAATMGMFDLQTYPIDNNLWHLLAYSTGTGGSILIIGSAAGVAVMGLEKIDFFWYLKNVSLLALVGYFAGVAVYILQSVVF